MCAERNIPFTCIAILLSLLFIVSPTSPTLSDAATLPLREHRPSSAVSDTTYTVNSDADPGDGTCTGDDCTLREAIQAANANPGKDMILFEMSCLDRPIPTIQPGSPLPDITDSVIIDASSWWGPSCPVPVKIHGSIAGADAWGLTITAGDSTIKELWITAFAGGGIRLRDRGENAITGVLYQNSGDGISIESTSDDNVISESWIAGNGGTGVAVMSGSTGNTLSENAIFGSGELGIDLNADGVTLNDAGDGDPGGNNAQNFPVLTSVQIEGSQTIVKGGLNSTPNTQFRLEFFSNSAVDDTAYGEGETFLDAVNVTTDGDGQVTFEAALDAVGPNVTATATNLTTGDTSEFSPVLGSKEVTPDRREIGQKLYYTFALRGITGSGPASLNDPIPENAAYVPGSLWASKGTPVYEEAENRVTWSGTVGSGETVEVGFAVTTTCGTPPVPPPPEEVRNKALINVGGGSFETPAVASVYLPERDLTTVADAPAGGAKDVVIQTQDGSGVRLQWHDQAAGLACGADPHTDDVFYRVYLRQRGGTWREIGTSPNCDRQIQLSPDDLACLDSGDPASYEWKVVAHDPEFPCRKPVETIFRFTTAACRPEIEVKPQLTLAPGYFLDNPSVNNPVKVQVLDWNGPAYEIPAPSPYGDVTFDLNGTQIEESGASWGAEHIYNMGEDFESDLSCNNNTLRVWASYPIQGHEFHSLETTFKPTVFPFPGWVEWVIQNIPGSDATFEAHVEAPLVEYTYDFKYPEPAFEALWSPPDWVPYVGGEEIGIIPTQVEANAAGKSDGSGTVGVSGETGLALAALSAEGKLWGEGEAKFRCGESLDLTRAEMGFRIQVPVEKEAGLTDVIPGAKAAESWPVAGRIIQWVNHWAKVKGSFTPAIEVKAEFEERNDTLQFIGSKGIGSIKAQATLATEVCKDLTASVYGGGTPYIILQVPANPGYLKEVGIDLYYGASFQVWGFEADYKDTYNCNYPGGCSQVMGTTLASTANEPAWHLIPRKETAAPTLWATGTPILQATGTTTETMLVSPAYARPEPSLAVAGDGTRLLAYIDDDAGDPHGQSTEVRAFVDGGSGWSGPTDLTDDEQPDFAPAVAFDGSGNGVVLWERSTLPAGITPSLNMTFARSLEIAARAWDGATWSPPVTLTNDGLMDFAPRLATGSDGSVMALWRTNDGTDMLGTATHPLTYTYALWDGSSWSAPAPALAGLQDVIGTAFAVYSSTQAALVYTVDADGVLSTTADSDLYYSIFNGTLWSGPAALTTDVITDTAPALAYDANGKHHLLWLRGDDLVALTDSWNVADAETVRASSAEGGFLGFTLSRDPNGNLATIWQTMDADGANLAYSVYDAAYDTWGADQTLMADTDVEVAHSPAFADGSLYLAYGKTATELVTKTFTVSPTHTFTVTNVPTPGLSSLVFLEHTVGRDLTFDSLTVAPSNPAAGQPVTLTAVLRNGGDLTVSSPQVAFYDGASPVGSTQTLPSLTAGTTTTIQINWTVPSPAVAHTLKAVADPNSQVSETNEANNEVAATVVLPDLQVDVLYTTHSSQAITATARLVNAGVLTTSGSFDVAFRAADPVTGTTVGQTTVGDTLALGGLVTVTQVLSDPSALVGLGDTLWAVVDSGDGVSEADEANNTGYAALRVLPDLTLAPADIQGYGPLTITVHNTGVMAASGALLSVRHGGSTGPLVYSDTLGLLQPGDSQVVTLDLSLGRVELWAEIDPDNTIAEINEGNNLAVRDVLLDVAPAGVSIQGPSSAIARTATTFTATVTPPTTTLPLTYTWQATDGLSQTLLVYSVTHAVDLAWDATGAKAVTVTAINARGEAVSAPYQITVACTALDEVSIDGPTTGPTGTLHTFTANVVPAGATVPIYTWSPAPMSGQGTASASYQWTDSGFYIVTLETTNCSGREIATHVITIGKPIHVYLPLVLR